jgi:protein-L-isoaspartate(D-aspartate) O-methyltransferase
MTVETVSSAEPHAAMVEALLSDHAAQGLTMRPEVAAALRAVPRHHFTPGVSLEVAYNANDSVIRKQIGDEPVSSVSAAWLIAEMLGQVIDAVDGGLSGRRVLEIGSGGYNASLLRELVGPSGSVTTVDIDPDVTERASACLAVAGYHDVTVICAEADQLLDGADTFDVIIATVGAWVL